MLDRLIVLRLAQLLTRQRFSYAEPRCSYSKALADALRLCWHAHKLTAAEAAYQATLPPIPAAVAEAAADMRRWAWYEPITFAGTARMVEQLAAAEVMEHAARTAIQFHR